MFLEAPSGPLSDCDVSNVARLVPGLGQIHHVLDLIEDDLTLVSYLGGGVDGTLGRDGPSFLHGFADLLEHEGEEGNALGDVVDVAFGIGDLGSEGIEEKREAETSTGHADDGGYDAVRDGISYAFPPSVYQMKWAYPISVMFVADECLRYVSCC